MRCKGYTKNGEYIEKREAEVAKDKGKRGVVRKEYVDERKE